MAFARTHLGGGEEADEVAAFVLGKAAKKTHLMGPNQMPKLVYSEVGADTSYCHAELYVNGALV